MSTTPELWFFIGAELALTVLALALALVCRWAGAVSRRVSDGPPPSSPERRGTAMPHDDAVPVGIGRP